MDMVDLQAEVITAGSGGTVVVRPGKRVRSGNGWDSANGQTMTSADLTIENGEVSSETNSGTEFTIDTSHDHVASGNLLAIHVEEDGAGASGTAAKGLIVTMGFRMP